MGALVAALAPEGFSGYGAFLTGVAAFISALFSLRAGRRRAEEDCDRRIRQLSKAYRRGLEVGRETARRDDDEGFEERWSGLP